MVSISQLYALFGVVGFWLLLFAFALGFSVFALRAPRPAEHEDHEDHAELEAHDQHGEQQNAAVGRDEQMQSNPAR